MTALYATLDALSRAVSVGERDPAWSAKMLHPVAKGDVVERVPWLLAQCKGKVVLHLGSAAGPLHGALGKVCHRLYGVDKVAAAAPGVFCVDLDWEPDALPLLPDVEIVLAAEVLEHLVNVGFCLKMVQEAYPHATLIVTCPNAFAPQQRLRQGIECVNSDHTFWPSWKTMDTMLRTCGYVPKAFHWYGGKEPYTAEGLIFVAHGRGA